MVDFSGNMKELYPDWNKDAGIAMYSFSRPSTILWNGIANALLEAGWTEDRVIDWLTSKGPRHALDGDLGDALEALARSFAQNITK